MRTKVAHLVIVMLTVSLILSVVSLVLVNNRLSDLQEKVEQNAYVKFQDRFSLDWDADDSEYLRWIAQKKGGSVEDRAYTILVTLNRVAELGYPISTMVELELGEKLPSDFVADYQSFEALYKITHEKFDNSEGSLQYRN